MNAFRPIGDFYHTGQDALLCDDCGLDAMYSCTCDDADEAPRCDLCDEVLIGELCRDCDSDALALAPVVRISPTRIAA